MKQIWQSLIKDHRKTLDRYFDDILRDLLRSMIDKQWRTREASCLAVADLLQGREFSQIEPFMEQLWTLCFRSLDDIKVCGGIS